MKRLSFFPTLVVICVAAAIAACVFAGTQAFQAGTAAEAASSAASELARVDSSRSSLDKQYKELDQKVSALESQIAVQDAMADQSTGYRVSGSVGEKIAYLTFDDGPSKNTPLLLQALQKAGIKATFFVIGRNSVEYPDALKSIIADGNVVGVHSWTHDYNYIYSDINNFKQDYSELNTYLTKVLGHKPDICRFPGGTNNTVSLSKHHGIAIMPQCLQVAAAMGLRPIDWDADAGDAEIPIPTTNAVVQRVLREVGTNHHPIILMHDFGNRTSTIDAISAIVTQLKAKGYSFDTLSASVNTATIFKPAASRTR